MNLENGMPTLKALPSVMLLLRRYKIRVPNKSWGVHQISQT